MALTFADRLEAAGSAVHSLLCVGLDPDPALMPVSAVAGFNRGIVDATADLVCAYKPNLAFYEALGLPGWRVLEATLDGIRAAAPHAVIIGDAKRGDVGGSASAYAKAMFDVWGFDAVTVNPWGGMDTVLPWLEWSGRGVFVWCRGSNPGASDFQELRVAGAGSRLYVEVARLFAGLGNGDVGLVAGATAPEALLAVRGVAPALPLLVPGLGAQGGDLARAVKAGVDARGRKALFSVSRGVNYASDPRRAAVALRDGINGALGELGLGWDGDALAG